MSELIRREDLENWLRTECASIDTYEDKEYVIGRLREDLPTVNSWHRVEEPPKEEGKYFVAYRSRVVDGWGYDTAYYTKHLEDKMLMIPVPENSEGWFKWSDYNDCDVLVHPDYWMQIEPPKEEKP